MSSEDMAKLMYHFITLKVYFDVTPLASPWQLAIWKTNITENIADSILLKHNLYPNNKGIIMVSQEKTCQFFLNVCKFKYLLLATIRNVNWLYSIEFQENRLNLEKFWTWHGCQFWQEDSSTTKAKYATFILA